MTTLVINIKDEQEEKTLLAFLDKLKYDYSSLQEGEINQMSLAVSQSSFSDGWDLNDNEENEYWDSFLK